MGELLLQERVITEEQLIQALAHQKGNPKALIGEVLVKLGFVDMRTFVETLAKQKPPPVKQDSPTPAQQTTHTKVAPSELSKLTLRLGETLFMEGIITEKQLQEALEYQQKYPGTQLGKALVSLGFASKKDVSNALLKMRQEK